MNESKSWLFHAGGRIEFRDSRSILRTGFGGLMALFGACFLTAMIVGVFRPGGWEAAVARPGNTLGVILFALFFFVVGWLAAFHRVRIVLDPAAREVAVVHDVFPFAHKRTHRLEDYRAAVMTTRRTAATAKTRSELVCSVRLVRPDGRSDLIASMYSITDASKLGNRIADILGSGLIEMSDKE